MDCCVSCRRHPKNLLGSSSCFPSCDFFQSSRLLQPSGRTCHKRSHQGTDPGTSKLIKRNNCSNCDATPTSKNQQVGQKLTWAGSISRPSFGALKSWVSMRPATSRTCNQPSKGTWEAKADLPGHLSNTRTTLQFHSFCKLTLTHLADGRDARRHVCELPWRIHRPRSGSSGKIGFQLIW